MRIILHHPLITMISAYFLMRIVITKNSNEKVDNKYKNHSTKITGGYHDSNSQLAKYIASLRKLKYDMKQYGTGHFCGGTIINPYVILTAAHCFQVNRDINNIQIVVGTIYRLRYTKWTQIIRIDRVLIHPDYDPTFHLNDISLVRLRHQILIDNKHTGIINLPHNPPKTSTKCIAAGWGHIFYSGPLPDEILYVELEILSEEECDDRAFIKTSMDICAKDLSDFHRDTCEGDSGGPLFSHNTVIGITSRGPPCGNLAPDGTGIYTNVYNYINWITQNSTTNNQVLYSFHKQFSFLFTLYFLYKIFFDI